MNRLHVAWQAIAGARKPEPPARGLAHRAPMPDEPEPLPGDEPIPDQQEPAPHPDPVSV